MTKKLEKVATDRRGFLKFAGLGAIASGATLVTGKTVQADEASSKKEESGYQETQHVKTFYQSARF